MRQPSPQWGASLRAAIRILILIVAPHETEEDPFQMTDEELEDKPNEF
jgi:hypothetical protein